jgi:hypothetical protein
MASAMPESMQKGMLYFAAAWVAASPIGLEKQPTNPAAPPSAICSTKLAPMSGRPCASPSSASSFAPPIALRPPAALTSSMAVWPPRRQSWPP